MDTPKWLQRALDGNTKFRALPMNAQRLFNKPDDGPQKAGGVSGGVMAVLADLQERADHGEIVSIAVAYAIHGEPFTRTTSYADTALGAKLLGAAVAELKHEYLHAARESAPRMVNAEAAMKVDAETAMKPSHSATGLVASGVELTGRDLVMSRRKQPPHNPLPEFG